MIVWLQHVLVVGMVFISSLGVAVDYYKRPQETWLSPIQTNRSTILLVLGISLGIFALLRIGRAGHRLLTLPNFLVILMAFYAALLRMVHEGPVEGGQSFAYAAATLVPLAVVVPAAMRDYGDMYSFLRILLMSNVAWIAAVALQVGISYKQMLLSNENRFVGMTANPQHCGTFLAAMSVVALWMLLNDPKRLWRFVWAGVLGVNLIMLVWTGSRTGAGMLVVGASLTLYTRMGRAVFFLPFAALFAFGAYRFVTGANIDIGAERLVSSHDTRGVAWTQLISEGFSSPAIGSGLADAGASENSYLLAFASYGVGMVLLIAALLVAGTTGMFRVFRARWSLPGPYRALADLPTAIMALYFAGAVFEGYMLSRVNPMVVLFVVFSAMGLRVTQLAEWERQNRYATEGVDEADEFLPGGATAAAS